MRTCLRTQFQSCWSVRTTEPFADAPRDTVACYHRFCLPVYWSRQVFLEHPTTLTVFFCPSFTSMFVWNAEQRLRDFLKTFFQKNRWNDDMTVSERTVMVTGWEWTWNRREGRQTEEGGGRREEGVNGSVSSVQVSLLRVVCPNTLLSPYLLPLSSSADTVCLDCRSPFLSLLSSISSFIITTPPPPPAAAAQPYATSAKGRLCQTCRLYVLQGCN